MQNALTVWSALDMRRRTVAVVASLAMFAAVLGLGRMAAQPDMALLYAGLEPAAAGEVLAMLDQNATAYEVRGGSIFVPAPQRDALRLSLAGQGLPANSGAGYELLDSLSGFGTTAQMFDAAYWRAKEGELARTITAAPDISAARVHVATSGSSPFRRDVAPSASVVVTAAPGALTPPRAMAIRFLVASAVAGMAADRVSVIDARSGVVVSGDETEGGPRPERTAELRRNIERLLEARVGPGNAVVEVSIETVTEREAITERLIDPESRVAISTETSERTTAETETGPGGVTVASNLPDGDGAGDSSAQSEDSETRETVNYEVSETRREVLRAPGAVRRLTVAVLIDGMRQPDPDGGPPIWSPRPPEELEALRDLVAAAVGLDPERGDEITLRSMEFRPLDALPDDLATGGAWFAPLDAMRLIQLGVLAAVTLALGLFVVRPVMLGRNAPPSVALAAPDRAAERLSGDGSIALPAPDDALSLQMERSAGALAAPPTEAAAAPEPGPDPAERLRQLIAERQEETMQILRSWMEDRGERT